MDNLKPAPHSRPDWPAIYVEVTDSDQGVWPNRVRLTLTTTIDKNLVRGLLDEPDYVGRMQEIAKRITEEFVHGRP